MNFNKAVKAMLDGNKVKWSNATGVGYGYIMLDDEGNVVDNKRNQVILNKIDFIADWDIANIPSAGTLLTRDGKDYWLIKEIAGTYAIIDAETYVEKNNGLTEESLVRDLRYFDIVD